MSNIIAAIRKARFPAGAAIVLCLFWAAEARKPRAIANEPPQTHPALPLVIPYPQTIQKAGDDKLVFGENGRVMAEIVLPEAGGFFGEARDLIEDSLAEQGFAGKADRVRTRILVATRDAGSNALRLTGPEEDALSKSRQAYIIRMAPGAISTVYLVGASPLGAYYAATTLVQLIEADRPRRAFVQNVEVRDFPDIPYRMCASWVLAWDWEVNGYDWGDGLEAFIARCKRKIDMCSRYKVNMVRFLGGRIAPGAPYTVDRYEMIKKFAPELNRYARRKGVSLQYSTVSWGSDYCHYGERYPKPWVLNRESYPDGPVYSCVGGAAGSCLSNEALSKIIADRCKQLVWELEPGSIYLHHADVGPYADCVPFWKERCEKCRRRFPDDELSSAKGLAGAVANLYSTLVRELKSIRNPDSGYDASRDLQIVFASPGYTYRWENDAEWERGIQYFQEVGRLVKDKKNVHLTFREQYNRWDNRGLRTAELARRLSEAGWPRAVFMFAVQGGGFDTLRDEGGTFDPNHNVLVSSPVLTDVYRGTDVLYNANGHVHSEAQVLANVNYAWNLHAPGWVNPATLAGRALEKVAQEYANATRHSDYLYGPFLEAACAKLYGKKAAPHMVKMFDLERNKGPLMPVLIAMERMPTTGYDWKGQAERNLEAKQFVDRALIDCKLEAKEDLTWLSKCLEAGARMCNLYYLAYRGSHSTEEVNATAGAFSAWLDRHFQFQRAEPDGGDVGSWKGLIIRAQQDHVARHPQAPR